MNREQFPKQPILKEKYLSKIDGDGYLKLSDCRSEFEGRQIKNIASLLDGSENINLGEGLRCKGDSGNYPDMKIHIDDLESFISRIRNYYK